MVKKSVQGGKSTATFMGSGINHAPSGVSDYLCFIVKNIISLTLVGFIIIFYVLKLRKKTKSVQEYSDAWRIKIII